MALYRHVSLETDANGELTIPGLPPGAYELGWSDGFGNRAGGWTSVTLGAGETLVTQTFPARAGRE
jgi:hypothetical protein